MSTENSFSLLHEVMTQKCFFTQKELFAFTTKYFLNFEFVFLKTGEKLL